MEEEEDPEATNKKRAKRDRREANKLRREADEDADEMDEGGRKRKRVEQDDAEDSVRSSPSHRIPSDPPCYRRRRTRADPVQKRQKVVLSPVQEQMRVIFERLMDTMDDEDHVRFLCASLPADISQPVHQHQRTGLFAALPSRAQYQDYYAIIHNPIVRRPCTAHH